MLSSGNKVSSYGREEGYYKYLYQVKPSYRENPCPKVNTCTSFLCQYYHKISQKRENIFKNNLLELKKPTSELIKKPIAKLGKGIYVTSSVPYHFKLDHNDAKNLALAALDSLKALEVRLGSDLPKNKKWH